MPLPEQVLGPLTGLVVSLINLQSPPSREYGRRWYSEIFRELPARLAYPDYYLVIKEPMSLNGVSESIKKGKYSTPGAVAYDLFLIWENARQYNQQGSLVYADADILEAHMRDYWIRRSPPLPPWEKLMRPSDFNRPAAPPAPPPQVATPVPAEPKIKKIKLTSSYSASPASAPPPRPPPPHQPYASTSSGTTAPARANPHLRLAGPSISTPAPAPATPSNPPITLKLALKPPAPPTAGPSYTSASPAGTPAAASPYPSYTETPKERKRERELTPGGSEKPRSERKKEKKARDKAERKAREKAEKHKLEGATEAAPVAPGIPDVESGWMSGDIGPNPIGVYLEIIRKLREHTDASGRPLATPFLTIPDPTSRPDYHELVKEPIALDTIENKARNGLYSTPEAFDRDLFNLFAIAKLFIRPGSPGNVYSDLIVLQRLYHELTKRRSAFELPIPSSGSLASSAMGPGNSSIKNEDGSFAETSGISSRPPVKDRINLESINFKGEVFRVGDWVHLINPDAPHRPVVAQIWTTFKRIDSSQRCFSVCWYYRPEETIHPGSRQFYENEVFKTSNYIEYAVEDFVERCMVMFHPRYIRGRPKAPMWTPGMPLYVCEHKYKDTVFKKIKNWQVCVPDGMRRHDYELDEFPDGHVDQPLRVKSPFVRGLEGPGGIGDSATGQAGEQAKYHFLPGGEPVTPSAMKEVERKAERERQEVAAALAKQQQAAAAAYNTSLGPSLYGADSSSYGNSTAAATPAPGTPFTITLHRPELGHSASASSLQSALPPQPTGPPPGATPAEIAALTESFSSLPAGLKSKFRSDAMGDLLWFTAPSAVVPVVSKPSHSLDYLYWRAMQKKGAAAASAPRMANGGGEEDVEMTDA